MYSCCFPKYNAMNLKYLVALEVSEYNLGGLDILDKLALIREDETGI